MTVHRIRLFHSVNGAGSYHNWLGQWLTNMQPWAGTEVTNELPTEREAIDGGTYYQTELAFEWSEDRAIILDQLDQYASSYCNWHRIGYHERSHDDEAVGHVPGTNAVRTALCRLTFPQSNRNHGRLRPAR